MARADCSGIVNCIVSPFLLRAIARGKHLPTAGKKPKEKTTADGATPTKAADVDTDDLKKIKNYEPLNYSACKKVLMASLTAAAFSHCTK